MGSNTTIMRWVNNSFSVATVGSNLNGPDTGNPKIALSSTINNKEYFDRATINIGEVNNKDLSPGAISVEENNAIIVNFNVILEDNELIQNGSKYWAGVGIKGWNTMVWIGQIAFIADVLPDRRPLLQIIPKKSETTVMQGYVYGSHTFSCLAADCTSCIAIVFNTLIL